MSGKLSAAGKNAGAKGGTIVVTGENIEVRGAQIDASGEAGGGKVLIGGDWAAAIRTSACFESEREARSQRDPDRDHGQRRLRDDDQRLGDG